MFVDCGISLKQPDQDVEAEKRKTEINIYEHLVEKHASCLLFSLQKSVNTLSHVVAEAAVAECKG